jgi:hypothetical protein
MSAACTGVSARVASSEAISAPAKASFVMAVLPIVDAAMRAAFIFLIACKLHRRESRSSIRRASVVLPAISGQYRRRMAARLRCFDL